ncbi:Voltage-dependent anion channel [Russula decolorans]
MQLKNASIHGDSLHPIFLTYTLLPRMPEKKSIADSIRHFPPAWFAVNMGTGAVSTLFALFPYGANTRTSRALSTTVFLLNLSLFIIFSAVSISRYTRHPDIWRIMIRHPVQSLYLSTFPMGAATLIGVGTTVLYGEYGFGGRAFLFTLWGLWWIDVAVSSLCCWGLVYVMITKHEHSYQKMTSVWLLPVITLIVASSVGGELAQALHVHSVTCALTTIAFTIFILSIGLALALMILTIYLTRLVLHGFPQGLSIVSSFMPLGPCGQAGFSVLLIGQFMKETLPVAGSRSPFLGSAQAGEVVFALCVCISFMLWAFATMWLVYALLGIQHILRRTQISFELAFWGMIFPNCVYAINTVALYQVLDVGFFRVWGAIYSGFTILLWALFLCRTIVSVPHGKIFEAPCLKELEMRDR